MSGHTPGWEIQTTPARKPRKLGAKLRREDIERWQAERREEVSGATCNKELQRLGHLLNRGAEWGYLKANPAQGA